MKVAVIGGGPAGLLFAALLRERRADADVELFEGNAADATYGFGVVFSEPTLRRIAEREARLGGQLQDLGKHWGRMETRIAGERLRCGGLGFSAIARRTLLSLLQDRALAAGVDVRFETKADVTELEVSHDLVIGADGFNSGVRAQHEHVLRPTVETAPAKYIWFGAAKAFESMTFLFERTEAGWFAVHAYPYDEDVSTFVVECDPATWARAGFNDFDAGAPAGVSDERTREAMQNLFAAHLDGAPLLANNSRWLNFRTLRTLSWREGSTVVIGDAAHTAHFSVGSGTTMALEDAIVLADEISAVSDLDEIGSALDAFERIRRPAVERIQDAAAPSRYWWESFSAYTALPPKQFFINFLTRSGRVSVRRLAQGDPGFFAGAAGGTIDDVSRRVLVEGPRGTCGALAVSFDGQLHDALSAVGLLLRGAGRLPHAVLLANKGQQIAELPLLVTADGRRDGRFALEVVAPSDPAGVDDALGAARGAGATPEVVVIARADDTLDARAAQIMLAERIRMDLGALVALVDVADDLDDVVTLVVSGRADFVVVDGGLAEAIVHSSIVVTNGEQVTR